ncbi:MAG: transglutaminase TgpA family protein, partial [Acidimicrobiales bacterium]
IATGTELALVAVTVTAALGLTRLFAGHAFAGPVLVAAVAAHGLAWWCRRQGFGLATTALLALGGLALAIAWLVEPHTTLFGVPRPSTVQAVGDDLRSAWSRFGEVKAPAPALRGFVLAAVAGVWLAATISDFFAFRMRARFEAMAPAFTLFVFGSVLGADRLRLPATVLYLAAVLTFVLWSEAARLSTAGAWFGGRARDGDTALLRSGAVLGVLAIVIAVLVGPHIPGAGRSGLVSLRDEPGGGSRSRVTVSPLVDIRGRLVDQSNVELFTVRTDGIAYWRLTSLDRFDGTIWSSLGTYQPASGALPGSPAGRPLSQTYSIGPLGSIWLPAAYRPDRLTGAKGARFDRDSGSLLAAGDTGDSLIYSVVSLLPELTAAQLQAASASVPDDIANRYLALPEAFPTRITALAQQVTAGTATPYEKARRLQDWFRSGYFTYSLNIGAGHDTDAMERFLFESRHGYCEQFAGTYAAMARALGLPARVAVGFVPGRVQSDGRYHVAGKDAHAWPEVYIAGYGWVAFEPTPGPGRNAPGTEAYTGLRAPSSDPTAPEGTVNATTTTAPPPDSSVPEPQPEEAQPPTGADDQRSGLGVAARAAIAIGLTAALYVLAVTGGRRALTRRRRAAAGSPAEQVLVAWEETQDALALAGHRRRSSETPGELAARAAAVLPESGTPMARLAADTDAAGFSADGVPVDLVPEAQATAGAVVRELRDQAGLMRRMRWDLDPRPLVSAIASASWRAPTRPS